MRRGTPAAYEFGKVVHDLRITAGLSCNALGSQLGVHGALVSDIERGTRALKEEKLSLWANALGVDSVWLHDVWVIAQRHPVQPIVRTRKKSVTKGDLELAIQGLDGSERNRVLGYIHALKEIHVD